MHCALCSTMTSSFCYSSFPFSSASSLLPSSLLPSFSVSSSLLPSFSVSSSLLPSFSVSSSLLPSFSVSSSLLPSSSNSSSLFPSSSNSSSLFPSSSNSSSLFPSSSNSSSLFPSSSVSSSFFCSSLLPSSSTKFIPSCFGGKWGMKSAVVVVVVTSGIFIFVVLRRYKHSLPSLRFSSFFSLPSYNTKKLLPSPPSVSSSSLPSVSSNTSSSSSSLSSPIASAISALSSSSLSSPIASAISALSSSSLSSPIASAISALSSSSLSSPIASAVDPISSSSSSGFWGLVGNTPTVRLEALSRDTECLVLGKCEFLNPGGSVKDRVARAILQLAEAEEKLKPGSTGISLAMAAKARGYQCCIYMPDDQAKEKSDLLKRLGAKVIFKKPVSIINSDHFCNAARRDASDLKGQGYYADQFENPANFLAHYLGTGEEIWRDTKGSVTAFVSAAAYNPNIKVILADPQGSALFGRVKHGVLYTKEDAEGYRTRHIFDTVTEGIGLNRLTRNFELGCDLVDDCFKVSDLEAVEMAHYLIEKEGLFLGSSSAVNCCGLVKAVKAGIIPKGSTIVTILCDSGMRHLSKFYNIKYLRSLHILPSYLNVPENENNEELLEDERDNETTTLNNNDDKKITYSSSPEPLSDIRNTATHKFVKPQSVWEFIQ